MADHDPHQDKGMEEVLEEVGLGVLTNSFIENRITPTDVLALSEQDFTLLGVTTIGDRVRLREQCRRLLNAEAKTPVLERLKLMQEKRKGKKKVSNNRKPQDCRKINIGWKHRHALTFTLMLANKGGGKFVIDVNKNLPISEFKNLIAEKYFPAGHNTYSNLRLEDLNYFLASFTGNPVEGVKTAGEYITQQQTSPLRIYLHTETKEQETTITEPTDGDNVPLQDYSVPMQVDNVTPQIDNATPRIDNATPRIDNATPRIDNATPRIDNATPRIDNATSRIDNATHRIDNATSRIDNATPRIDNATSRIDNATSRIDNATSHVDNVHAEAVHFYNAGTPTIQFSSYRRCDLSLDNQENAEAPSSLPLPVDDKDETLDDIGLPAIQFRRRRGRHSLSLQQRRLQTASVPDQPCTSSTIESSGFVTWIFLLNYTLTKETMVLFKVDHEHFSSTMCMMNTFRKDSSLCDVKLMIGNQTLQAHRCVLAAGSPYFNSLFLGQFPEANMKEINLSKVTSNITALKEVVTFIYTGEINIGEDNLGVIINLSSFFLIDSLRNFCCTFMTDNLSLATCLRYYLLSLEHGLVAIEKLTGPMVLSRFHDYLIYEDATLDVSTDEMEFLVERNILQHCFNVSIVRFIALWVNKWLTELHVLIAKSIFDDLVLRKNSPEVCTVQLTNDLSDDSLYNMIESSLSVKCKTRDMFLNSFKQVLKKMSSENNMHIVKTKSDHPADSNAVKETAIITVSPSYENLEYIKKNRNDPNCLIDNKAIELETEVPILHVCAYVPRTRCWYHLKKIYKDRSSFAYLKDYNLTSMWTFDAIHDELLIVNFGVELMFVIDLKNLEDGEIEERASYSGFLYEVNESGRFDTASAYDICLASGKDSLFLVSRVRRFDDNINRFLGSYFSGYKLHEDGKTWQKMFQTGVFDAPCEEDDLINMYAKISSVSNEMMVVLSAEQSNIVFVVDLNQENASQVTLLSSLILKADMILGKVTKIVEANDAMYIVSDGTAVENMYSGKASVRYEYKLKSLCLREIHSTAANIGQLNEA